MPVLPIVAGLVSDRPNLSPFPKVQALRPIVVLPWVIDHQVASFFDVLLLCWVSYPIRLRFGLGTRSVLFSCA